MLLPEKAYIQLFTEPTIMDNSRNNIDYAYSPPIWASNHMDRAGAARDWGGGGEAGTSLKNQVKPVDQRTEVFSRCFIAVQYALTCLWYHLPVL
jgi:hypothetical protein